MFLLKFLISLALFSVSNLIIQGGKGRGREGGRGKERERVKKVKPLQPKKPLLDVQAH